MLDRMQQYMLEEQVNTHNIKHKLKEILKDTDIDGAKYLILCECIDVYLQDNSTKPEIIHLNRLKSTQEIAKSIILAVAYAKTETPIQAISATLSNELCYKDPFEGVKVAAELLYLSSISKLYVVRTTPNRMTVTRQFDIPEELELQLELAIYPLPMVCKPNPVSNNKNNIDSSHLLNRSSLLLGKNNHHTDYICKDVIDIANSVELSLDLDIVEYEELPNKPLDTKEKLVQFIKLAVDSETVYTKMLELGNKFYLTWKFDFRGRMYSQGYHINIQSTEYKKALICFSKQEVIEL